MAVAPLLILFEYIISLTAQIWSLYIFGQIVIKLYFCKSNKITVISSPSLILYFVIQTIQSIAAVIYVTYLLLGWKSDSAETQYNSFLMFFTGANTSILLNITPISAFALGIDRCFCVLFPVKYSKNRPIWTVFFALFLMALFFIWSLINRIIPVFPIQNFTKCSSFSCFFTPSMVENYNFLRYFSSTLILISSIILLIAIRQKFTKLNTQTRKSNNTVLLTLAITFTLDFLPHLASALTSSIFQINLIAYTGPVSLVISSLESGICAFIYRNVCKKQYIHVIRSNQQQTTAISKTFT